MNKLRTLVKRNLKCYFANKSNILFSSLAIIILLVLHFIFLRKLNANPLILLKLVSDNRWAYWYSDSLTFAAIIPIGAITLSITTLSQIIKDKEKSIIDDFYISPISKNQLMLSYLLSSFTIGFIFIFVFLIIFNIYFWITYNVLFTFIQFILLILIIILSLFFANILTIFIVSFINREQTIGSIGTVLGTLSGFLTGSYVSMGMLGEKISTIFTLLPFLPLTALSKKTFLLNSVSNGLSSEIINGDLGKINGYVLYLNNYLVSNIKLLLIIFSYMMIIIGILYIVFKNQKKNE